jgi:hypothetical protein
MDLTGIAGRALLQRLSVGRRRENDRAASNDNEASPVELARAKGEEEAPALAKSDRLSPRTTVRRGVLPVAGQGWSLE